MADGYHHLTYGSRCQIYALRESGLSLRGIGRQLRVPASTISREVRRNSGQRGYRHRQAHGFAVARRREASSRPRKMTAALWAVVEEKLGLQWSPEQISGRLRVQGVVAVGKTWIYHPQESVSFRSLHVWSDRASGGTLFCHLRRRGKKRNRRGRDGAGRGVIPGRIDICERPAVVEEKSRVGDWEVDTIIGAKHQGALVSVVDWASKFTFLEHVTGKTAVAVGDAIRRCLMPVLALVHTITADNGKEFAGHQLLAKTLSALFFFATPYHSWERGLNEHTNGLVRQYFPKSTDFKTLDPAEVKRVQELLNNRPRRVLGYRTPAEVFCRALDALEDPEGVSAGTRARTGTG